MARRTIWLIGTLWLAAWPLVAPAQMFPNRPIRVIVPYPAGGAVDIVARTLGHQMSDDWKQQVVIDNRPGSGGVIATEILAQGPADGYPLIMGAPGHALDPGTYAEPPYDPFKAFTATTDTS